MASRPPSPSDPSASGPGHRPVSSIPRYKVLLHGTPEVGLLFIVAVLRELTHFGEAEAMSRMWEAYHRGRATVLVTHLERAELYVEQFADRGLTTSIEPV